MYKPYAAERITGEIGSISRMLQLCGEEIVKQEIMNRISDERKIYKNTWKAAVYEAIYVSTWFWEYYLPNYGR